MAKKEKRIGILTGGGDCPGLNAGIRAITKTALQAGYKVTGIRNGWRGFMDSDYVDLDAIKTSGILDRGGTILGISRLSPFKVTDGVQKVFDGFAQNELEALVVLGGEGTLTVTSKLFGKGLPVIGIPKTIDNDVMGTDYTIGFQTAVQIATEGLDRLRSTAESHHRVMLLEVMGRHTGWIATYAGMANGADAILIPEVPLDDAGIDELCHMLINRNERGINFSIVVVAEGTKILGQVVARELVDVSTKDRRERLGGAGKILGKIIEDNTQLETRVSSLGHIQRGGTPVAYDRSLAIAFGVRAVELIQEKKYGKMTSLRGNRITEVPLSEVAGGIKTVHLHAYSIARRFFG